MSFSIKPLNCRLTFNLFQMRLKGFIQRNPVTSYYIGTFSISWLGAFILVSPKLLSGQPIPKLDGILMFPVMLIGPVAASFTLTYILEGKPGIRSFVSRFSQWKAPLAWYIVAIGIPPCLIWLTLTILQTFVSSAYKPNFFLVGFLFGIPAGYLEEIGWTGFAYNKLRLKCSVLKSSLIVGLFWGLWHFPVIDFLGAATPHRQFLIPFFIAFITILVSMRLLMMWIYSKTGKLAIVQLMHMVSTGCLVTFGPFNITPGQETLWYGDYGIVLAITALLIYKFSEPKMI